MLLHAVVHAADIQDRDGGVLLMSTLFGAFPFLLKLYADSGYQGPKFQDGLNDEKSATAVPRWETRDSCPAIVPDALSSAVPTMPTVLFGVVVCLTPILPPEAFQLQ